MNRKQFLTSGAILTAGALLYEGCTSKPKKISGKIVGASASVGHLLRDGKINITSPETIEKKKIVIVGGGVSGLSAARFLYQQNEHDFVVLDLEKEMGGNAAYDENEVSKYPWGAHYIPIPNNDLTEYLNFLHESNVITGFNEINLPVYNELFLCFDPKERLYINGRWQDGLVPQYGVPDNDLKQIQSFLQTVDDLRYKKGNDGKDVFTIPVNHSSKDEAYVALDSITMKQWLHQNNFTSDYLHWYVNYCMCDDFGTPLDKVSAWIGLHYYAARKGRGTNAAHDDVLTWQQGNGWLVSQLKKNIGDKLNNNCLVVNIKQDKQLLLTYYDVKTRKVKAFEAEQCILAIPQFVAARLLSDDKRIKKVQSNMQYAPWMVANIQTQALQERSGVSLSWDNVLYKSQSLGYVNATQQMLQQNIPQHNLTYYKPLTENTCDYERKKALITTHEQWVDMIVNDLKVVHPDIEQKIINVNIMVWGHAMAQPLPGIAHGSLSQELAASIRNKIHFAHTDLAGISIFEEAFYQGLNAATNVLKQLL